jgi:hypothetical protein
MDKRNFYRLSSYGVIFVWPLNVIDYFVCIIVNTVTELWDLNVVKRGFSSIYPKIDVIL